MKCLRLITQLCRSRFVLGVLIGVGCAAGALWLVDRFRSTDAPSTNSVVARVDGEAIYARDYLSWIDEPSRGLESPESALADLAEQAALAGQAERLGLTEAADYRAAERSLKIAFLRERKLQPKVAAIRISDEEIEAAYADLRDDRFLSPARYEVAALWLNHRGRDDLKTAYQQRLQAVRDTVLNEEISLESGFGAIALSASEHRASRFQGGVLGWLDAVHYPDPIHAEAVAAAERLEAGAVSEVMTRAEGVFLVRLLRKEAAAYRSLEEVRGLLESELRASRRAEMETSLAADALADADVILFPENLPAAPAEPRVENLYRIKFEHHYAWLPIAASDPDRSEATVTATDPEAVGLWLGEVLLGEVTSATEAGHPVRPTSSVAPMRVILHVDESGQARLLRDVLVMQTKTASESVAPEQVLIVNEAKVSFYKGILERGGKRVGLRIETVGYDLPRAFDPATQQALVNTVATALSIANPGDVTAANIQQWVEDQSTRPTSLVESYEYHWPLAGSLTAGGELTGILSMDAFHRTNPFRHAFHPSHGTGRVLTRAITIDLDSNAPGAGLLTGSYQETIIGLGAVPLTTGGRLTLERVSTVDTLVE
jgi:parvulin-like peptidyl-prolyl isomerase